MKESWIGRVVLLALIGLGAGYCLGLHADAFKKSALPQATVPARMRLPVGSLDPTLNAWLLNNPDEIDGMDIATLNLVCLAGLPGTEQANLSSMSRRVEDLAQRVEARNHEMQEWVKEGTSKEWPREYWLLEILTNTIKEEFAGANSLAPVSGANQKILDQGFSRPDEFFFKGSSDWKSKPAYYNPVLMASLARKLGYPVKLMASRSHIFLRWERPDGRGGFNYEIGSVYNTMPPDREYGADVLKLSNSREELAFFLFVRGSILEKMGYREDAWIAYAAAQVFAPNVEYYQQRLLSAIDRQMKTSQISWKDAERQNAEYFRLKKPDPVKPPLN